MNATKSSKQPRASFTHTGSSFDDFLDEAGIRNEVEAAAIKKVLAWQFVQEMLKQQKTKQSMAKELRTSRSQLDRLLDPENTAVSLETLTRAANVLGKQLVFEIRDKKIPRHKPIAQKSKNLAPTQKLARRA
jgi:antitoxin HicB